MDHTGKNNSLPYPLIVTKGLSLRVPWKQDVFQTCSLALFDGDKGGIRIASGIEREKSDSMNLRCDDVVRRDVGQPTAQYSIGGFISDDCVDRSFARTHGPCNDEWEVGSER